MLFDPKSIEVTSITGQLLKIHLVSTGGVIVKTKFQQANTTGLPAKIIFMLDRKYTDWLPIWVMVIEHPEGIFVVDTGENANINDPGYFSFAGPMVRWFNTTQYKFKVDREEEIDKQLKALGISADKVKMVILTHLHLDHIDGLRHFPNTKIIVNKAEWEKPFGDLPQLYPSWFQPELVELNEQHDVFEKAFYVTEAKDIALIETPGHTWHHCSVILKTEQGHILFGADVCYTQQQIIDNKYSGANASHKLSKKTYSKVRSLCKNHKTVFIPSHEAAAGDRLKHLQFITLPD
jgi:glyoxylase-like metal-dependent hydrolase (beta-lactamase superfamily II)